MTSLKTLLAAAFTAAALPLLSLPALAQDGVHIENPYARSMGGIGASGAVFFEITNHADVDDRLIDARSDVAEKVELHTHKDDGNGVMQMLHVPEGFAIPAQGTHALQRGGDHVMLMGLKAPLKDGDIITVTLIFDGAAPVTFEAVVDNNRKPEDGMGEMDHSKMGHSTP